MEILSDRVRERGATLVMVTHNEELVDYADRVIYMRDGRLHRVADRRTGQVQEFTYEDEADIDEFAAALEEKEEKEKEKGAAAKGKEADPVKAGNIA